MGRYEKIKVYNGSSFVKPSRIRIYNNGWQDIGTDTSYSTVPMYVRKADGSNARATLNRRDYTVVDDQYASGAFNLLPASGFCFYTANAGWYFRATIYKESDISNQIFYCGTGTTSYIKIVWNANGTVTVSVRYNNSTIYSVTSSNAVTAGNYVYLNVYAAKGSTKVYVVLNGVTTSATLYNQFIVTSATNVVGSTGMRFKDTLSASGAKYPSNTYSVSFNTTTANGTDNSQYVNLVHTVVSHTETVYE